MARGRKPKPDLTVVPLAIADRRPPPPSILTERQQAIWREVVGSEPVDWFAAAAVRHILADYCRHREAVEMVDAVVADFTPEQIIAKETGKHYRALLAMRQSEARASVTMATKLRLTVQSRIYPRSAGRRTDGGTGTRPWEPDGAA